jgi:hypothetical protein
MPSRNASDNNWDSPTTKDSGSGRTSSQSPQARRGSAQDYTQFEERGEVSLGMHEPTLEKSDNEKSSPSQQAPYWEGGGGRDLQQARPKELEADVKLGKG